MKFTCEKNVLNNAVANVIKAVTSRSTLPVLEGIYIKANDDELILTGYDLELGIETKIAAKVEEEGAIVLPASYFYNIIRKMPGEMIKIETDEKKRTSIVSGHSNFQILGLDAAEYPLLPNSEMEESFTIEAKKLKNMIDMTIFAVSSVDTRPVQTGSLFDIEEGVLKLVSVDGFRLALRKEVLSDYPNLSCKFVVPGKTLSEISKLIDGLGFEEQDKISVLFLDKHVIFKIREYKVVARLLEGEFLKYENSIPKDSTTEVMLKTREMIDSIERTSLLISERIKSPLKFQFKDDFLAISCVTAIGKSYDEVFCDIKGEPVLIGFNHRYLLDAFRNSGEEELLFKTSGALSPAKITAKDSDRFIYIVLPLRLKNEEN